MKPFRLNRRTFLRGTGGVAMALPMLDAMLDGNGEALAQGGASPKRYAIVFAGQALGGDQWEKDRFMVAGTRKQEAGHFMAPATTGADYTLTTPLKPLAALKDDFNVISGMRIPWNATSTEGTAVPEGGAFRDFHGGGCSPLLSGVRSTTASFRAEGISSDQVIANLAANKGKTLIDSLVVRAQPSWYLAGSSYAGRQYLSYAAAGKPIESQTNPQTVFNSLFANFKPVGGDAIALADFERRAELSVLSLIRERRQALINKVGKADRIRLEGYFDQIRDLETRIGAIAVNQTATCSKPTDPGNNWPIGSDNAGNGGAELQTNTGYSDEAKRAEVLSDLIAMAFACDLTRVATLQITVFQSHMNVSKISESLGTPMRADLHEVGHNGDPMTRGQFPVSLMLSWHVGIYARLLAKLKASAEGAGNVLDNSAIVFMNEAGHGTQLNDSVSINQTHSVENMCLLVAGRAGGMKPGRHIATAMAHPGRTLLAAMKAVGAPGDAFGDVRGALPDLI
jgi:hypothetical protein